MNLKEKKKKHLTNFILYFIIISQHLAPGVLKIAAFDVPADLVTKFQDDKTHTGMYLYLYIYIYSVIFCIIIF